jgi:hypothetical protein
MENAAVRQSEELRMADQRISSEKESPRQAEVEKNAESNRQSPTEAEQKKQEVEYDEVLDDRFQATDN